MSDTQLNLELRGSVALLTLDDGKANALRPGNLQALIDALEQIETNHNISAVVLTGRPGVFSAGLDLKLLPILPRAEQAEAIRLVTRALMKLFLFSRPTVAAMTGHALAGGALLALSCDTRFSAAGAFRFGVTEVALGLTLPSFGVEIVRHAVSAPLVTRLALHAAVLSPAQMLEAGIVEAVLPPEQLLDAALAKAQELAKLPTRAFAATKRKVRESAAHHALGALEGELLEFSDVLGALTRA